MGQSPPAPTALNEQRFDLTGHSDDRDHLFRSIATSVARVLTAPLDDGVVMSVS